MLPKLDPHVAVIEAWLAAEPQLTAIAIVTCLPDQFRTNHQHRANPAPITRRISIPGNSPNSIPRYLKNDEAGVVSALLRSDLRFFVWKSGDVPDVDLHQVVDDGIDVPVGQIGRAWQNGGEASSLTSRRAPSSRSPYRSPMWLGVSVTSHAPDCCRQLFE